MITADREVSRAALLDEDELAREINELQSELRRRVEAAGKPLNAGKTLVLVREVPGPELLPAVYLTAEWREQPPGAPPAAPELPSWPARAAYMTAIGRLQRELSRELDRVQPGGRPSAVLLSCLEDAKTARLAYARACSSPREGTMEP